jgi:hypothetical protein
MAQGTLQAGRPGMALAANEKPNRNSVVLRLLLSPWPALTSGAILLILATLWLQVFGTQATILVFLGLLAAGSAVAIRPMSPLVLGLAGLCAFASRLAIVPEWDSLFLLTWLLSLVAIVGAMLVAMPLVLRKIAISVLLLAHFGAIITAATQVQPTFWLTQVIWSRVTLPYLEVAYLTNAYHFYSPSPGPATAMWFFITYDDGATRWYNIPKREDHPLGIEYQRRLSITEYASGGLEPVMNPPRELTLRRYRAGQLDGIPMHALLTEADQFRVPNANTKMVLESYARRVARSIPHLTDPTRRAVSVKIYRLPHNFLHPTDVAKGKDPLDKDFYLPSFMGEYDPDGNLMYPRDPYLYWVIPSMASHEGRDHDDPDPFYFEFVERHAHLNAGANGVPNPEFKAGQSDKHD